MTTLYTVAQVARELGLVPRTVRDLAKRRHLGRRMGPIWVFTPAELANMRVRRRGAPPRGQGGK